MFTLRRMKKDWFAENPVHSWSRGDCLPTYQGKKFTDVIELDASGDELDYIRNHFSGVPVTHNNYCVWKGMIAQFIYDNLD